ncbi:hypothetical protein DFQ27_006048 [Actinomortierella ambigua]|uniref:Uncharacterized protein n=1 Tax=Actinomortierella ambigua TaxID=1343610 RepID=A0A9P6QJH4_9FUNG|nr:hypothetical protein DFQ27_006048 [Actinomortierella ambigua]
MDTPEHVDSHHSHHFIHHNSSNDGVDQDRRWIWWISCALLALVGYVARDYPAWRAKQKLLETATTPVTKSTTANDINKDDQAGSPSSTPGAVSENDHQPWPPRFSARWIPFMPFALVYLCAKVVWSFFRWLVFHSLWFIEQSSSHIALAAEKAAVFAVENGPDLVYRHVVLPVKDATNSVWQSFVVEWCRPKFEQVVVPAVVHACTVVQEITVKHYHSLAAFTARWADPVILTMTWVALELVYLPLASLASRLAVVGQTFLHTANIYLQELAKDALDLLHLIGRTAQWLWSKALRPLGLHLARLGSIAACQLWATIQKSGLWIYSSLLRPSWDAVISAIVILRSHPTLLAGLRVLSAKVQTEVAKALHRIEQVNWLLLLEEVLTRVFTFLYQFIAQALTLAGRAISYFFVEMIPNAYKDLQSAIEFMRPIVEWVVLRVLAVVRPCWWMIVSLTQWMATNAGPFLAMLNRTIWTPVVQAWQMFMQPVLARIVAMTIQTAVATMHILRQVAPWITSVLAPLWKVVGEISDVLSRMATELGRILLSMTGELGVKVQQALQEMAPQFEAAKTYLGRVLDDMVVWANNAMVDWVKKEKRE